ncbi:zinc finger protein [Hirschfeldia incana]|nr:zinc finger protein [Hirschfeldia incana]
MSNPEKKKVDDACEKERKDSSDEQCSDEEFAMREIVLGLPALSITSGTFGVSIAVDENEEARLNEQAVVAAELVIAAAEEAVMKEKSDGKKKKVRRPRKTMKLNDDEAGGSSKGGEEATTKKPRRRTSEFTNLPRGPPVCNVCGRAFNSWKAVFGHLRSHKDRNYRGFLPPPKFTAPTRGVPPKFTAPTRGVMIPGPNSAFVRVVARGGSSGGVVTGGAVVASGGGGVGATGGEGGRGSGIDMNVDAVEEGNQEVTESGTVAKFDLNKSPPKDDEDEEEKTK